MTGLALQRRRFVEEHGLSLHFAGQFVTFVAAYVTVRPPQRERGARVVVKFTRLPPRRVVATGTVGCVFARGKLSRMGVVVTAGALFRSCAEIDIFEIGLQRGRAMTIGAGHSAVRAKERKCRL